MNKQLIKEHFDLAIKTGRLTQNKYLDESEREAIATDVLIKCSENFDNSKNTKFTSYLITSIKFEIGQKSNTEQRRKKRLCSLEDFNAGVYQEGGQEFNIELAEEVYSNCKQFLTREEQELFSDMLLSMKNKQRERFTKEQKELLIKLRMLIEKYYGYNLYDFMEG